MTKLGRPSVLISLFAAYVIALQALLLPLSVGAAPSPLFRLCQSAASNGGAPDDRSGCPCAAGCGMQCCAPASMAPPAIAIAHPLRQTIVFAPPRFAEAFVPPSQFAAHSARGPPGA